MGVAEWLTSLYLMGYCGEVARIVNVEYVCDECGSRRRKAKPYRVAQDGDAVRVLLCREHGQYLDHLIKLGERVPSASPRVKVWSVEEIEKERRRQSRKPPSGPVGPEGG